jgi:hypothetical protein
VPTTTSNLNRFRPRPAAIAAMPPHKKYQQAVAQARQAAHIRKRLPRTQEQFYADRLNQQ